MGTCCLKWLARSQLPEVLPTLQEMPKTQRLMIQQQMMRPKPQKIGDYTILEFLGQGGFGKVNKARNSKNEEVALKRIPLQLDQLNLVKKEAEMLFQFKHKNIVPVYDFFPNDKQHEFIIVLEYCTGGELAKRIGNMEDKYKLKVIQDISEGVLELHLKKIIHRDLKPENILLGKDGTAKITDLGLARVIESSSGASTMLGTISYMAPEIVNGGSYTTKIDIWSLGLIFLEILVGKRIREMYGAALIPWLRPEFPGESVLQSITDEKMRKLVVEMLNKTSEERPNMPMIMEVLKSIRAPGKYDEPGSEQVLKHKQVGAYTIVSLLGNGSFCRVYKARSPNDKEFALRIYAGRLKKQFIIQRAKFLQKIIFNNVANLYEFFEIKQQKEFVLIQEYCEKGGITKNIGKIQNYLEKIQIMQGIAEGVRELHQRKIIHRDLKPQNILLDKHDTPKILGLEGVHILKDEEEEASEISGTMLYMAPEMARGDRYTVKVDVWALGLVFFEMLIGQRIYSIYKDIPPCQLDEFPEEKQLKKIADKKMRTLVVSMLQKNPKERFDIYKVAKALEEIQTEAIEKTDIKVV